MGKKKHQIQQLSKTDLFSSKEIRTLITALLEETTASLPPIFTWNDFKPIVELLDKLKQIQSPFTSSFPPREDCLEPFLQWANQLDASSEKLKVQQLTSDLGFGLIATEPIEADEEVISIPYGILLTTEYAEASNLATLFNLKKSLFEEVSALKLCISLLNERHNECSFWKSYIDFLPRTYSNPIFWSCEEFELAAISAESELFYRLVRNLARQYCILFLTLEKLRSQESYYFTQYFTWEEFRWSVASLMSRQNVVPNKQGSSKQVVLIPYWDLLNHTEGEVTTFFHADSLQIKCTAMKNYNPGEEVHIYYGRKSSAEFLMFQGFTPQENISSKITIKLGMSEKDELAALKKPLLHLTGTPLAGRFHFYPNCVPMISPDLLTFVRIFVLKRDETGDLLNSVKNNRNELKRLSEFDQCISIEHEVRVWKYLEMRVFLLSRQYTQRLNNVNEELKESHIYKLIIHEQESLEVLRNACIQYRETLEDTQSLTSLPYLSNIDHSS